MFSYVFTCFIWCPDIWKGSLCCNNCNPCLPGQSIFSLFLHCQRRLTFMNGSLIWSSIVPDVFRCDDKLCQFVVYICVVYIGACVFVWMCACVCGEHKQNLTLLHWWNSIISTWQCRQINRYIYMTPVIDQCYAGSHYRIIRPSNSRFWSRGIGEISRF
jgi:hypothetical protein